MENSYSQTLVADAVAEERVAFYKKTYTHVAYALLIFIALETLLIYTVPPEWILTMLGGRFTWLFIIGLFWLGSTFSNNMAFHPDRTKQYTGLGLYILLEAIIFLPMIYIAMIYAEGANLIAQAGLITLFMFGGLTATVFLTNKDFSFLRTVITIGGFVALGIIVAGAIFGFDLGLWFSAGMIVLASAGILYQTHQIKNEFSTDMYVGAALQIFSSILLLFWYVLRLLMRGKD
jgi:FtsH-binding integral membrane protein